MSLRLRRFRFQGLILIAGFWLMATGAPANAGAWEKHLLVLPLRPANESSNISAGWFSDAFHEALAEAFLSINTVVFLKNDEVSNLAKEYKLKPRQDPEPGLMEKIADDKELAIVYGSFTHQKNTLTLNCHIIPGRGDEGRSFTVTGTDSQVRTLFAQVLKETLSALELKPTENALKELTFIPGTNAWPALEAYTRALESLRQGGTDTLPKYQQTLAHFDKAVKLDPAFVSAAARRISLRLTKPNLTEKERKALLPLCNMEIASALVTEPANPLLEITRLEIFLAQQQFQPAIELGQTCIQNHVTNYRSYLLLGRAYLGANQWSEAEKVLMKALDQQGTALQKKPFNLELGLLLLNHKDKLSENFLKEVITLEPKNAALHYWRALALFNTGRWLDTMDEIQFSEALHKTEDLKQLKAKTTLALGNEYFKTNELSRAYTFTSMAVKLRPRHFETCLLMAKVLRKKGYLEEAHKQLENARAAADSQRDKDHFLLGTEYVAQGLKEEGAQEYVTYLKLNPNAPERTQLIQYIRKLRSTTPETESEEQP
jgi:tetratricopeptide (TPR) repeat protein